MVPDLTVFRPLLDLVAESKSTAAGLIAVGALAQHGVRYWWDRRNLKKGNFRRRVLIFAVRFDEPDGPNGPVDAHFKPIGDEHELREIIGIPALEDKVARATRHTKDGLLCISKDGSAHKRMMHILERKIQGNDPIGMSDWVKHRPTHNDLFAFSPGFFREDEVSMIYVFVVDADELLTDGKRLRDPQFRARMRAADLGHHDESVALVKKMGEQPIDPDNKDEENALVRFTPVTTAMVVQAA